MKYIGLTIGPIIKTISNAEQTGELWGSSYIFSYIMKRIIKELTTDIDDLKRRFIVPCINNILDGHRDVGVFHDRFIFQAKDKELAVVDNVVKKVRDEIAEEVWKSINKQYEDKKLTKKYDEKEVKEFILKYFKIYYAEIELNDDSNIILSISNYLNALELRESYIDIEKENYLNKVLNNKDIKSSFLARDAYGKDRKEPYPSLLKISTRELNIIDKAVDSNQKQYINEDNEIEGYIQVKYKDKKEKVKKCHEYSAIVQIDGDSMSNVIGNLKTIEECQEFSAKLLDYSIKVNDIIKDYNGFTVYSGGDDLLFLAPLVNRQENKEVSNIFMLIDQLSEEFNHKFEGYMKKYNTEISISVGLAAVHYKYPLRFSLEEARHLLEWEAKEYNNKEKNAVAFKVIKHSGDSFSATLGKDSKVYESFKKLFNEAIVNFNSNEEKKYLNQIHIKLMRDQEILKKIMSYKKEDKVDVERLLANYFKNNFNEEIHKTQAIKQFLIDVKELMISAYETLEKGAVEQIGTCLKFVRFMNEKTAIFDKKKGGE